MVIENRYSARNNKMNKYFIIGSSGSFLVSIIILMINSPVTGYEISIFSDIMFFWIFYIIAAGLLIPAAIIVTRTQCHKSSRIISGLGILYIGFLTSTPIIRGYYLYGAGDPVTHFRYILHILSSGRIGTNEYPILHILAAAISTISSTEPHIATQLTPVVGSIVLTLFVYLLTRLLYSSLHGMWAVIFFLTFPYSYYHISAYPQSIALFLLPMVFYLVFRPDEGSVIALILIIPIAVIAHPVIGIIIVIYLILIWVVECVVKNQSTSMNWIFKRQSLSLALFSAIVFLAWGLDTRIFQYSLRNILVRIFGNIAPSTRGEDAEPVVEQTTAELVFYVSKTFGNQLVLLSIAGVVFLYVLYLYNRKMIDRSRITTYILLFSLIGLGEITYIGLLLGTGFITLGRFLNLNIAFWLLPIVCASIIVRLIIQIEINNHPRPNQKQILASCFAFILITSLLIAIPVGVLSTYRSPWIDQPNWQHTYEDAATTNWSEDYATAGEIQVIGASFPSQSVSITPRYDNEVDYIYINNVRQNNIPPVISQDGLMGVWAIPEENMVTVSERLDNESIIYTSGSVDIYTYNQSSSPV